MDRGKPCGKASSASQILTGASHPSERAARPDPVRCVAYPAVARWCRFTYSQSRLVIADGGMDAVPNSDSSVSSHTLKQTAQPPNATFLCVVPCLGLRHQSSPRDRSWNSVSVALRSPERRRRGQAGRRSHPSIPAPPGNPHQPAARLRRAIAGLPTGRPRRGRFSGEVRLHRTQTYDPRCMTASGQRFSPQMAHTISQVRGRGWTGQPQVGQVGSLQLATVDSCFIPA